MLLLIVSASSKRESVWRGRAPVRLRGGGAVLSQLGNAPALEAELGTARAALDASQKAARKARREARRREAFLQAELDDLEAGRRAGATREPGAPVAGVLPRDQATSLAVADTPPPPKRSGVTRVFRLLNSAVLLACALGLAAVPTRSIGLLIEIDLSGKGVGFLAALLARTVSALLGLLAASLWLMTPRRAAALAALLAGLAAGVPLSTIALTDLASVTELHYVIAALAAAPAVALLNLAALASDTVEAKAETAAAWATEAGAGLVSAAARAEGAEGQLDAEAVEEEIAVSEGSTLAAGAAGLRGLAAAELGATVP